MVQTFLPYSDFKKCARILNTKHLCKQRVEAYQLINAIEKEKKSETNVDSKKIAWINHPVTVMWKNNLSALKLYYNCMIDEMEKRGFKNNMIVNKEENKKKYEIEENVSYPWWLGWEVFHYSHQASLLRKSPSSYVKYFKNLPEEYRESGYVWPSKLTSKQVKDIKESLGSFKNGKKLNIKDVCYATITPVKNIEWYTLEAIIDGKKIIRHITNCPREIEFIK